MIEITPAQPAPAVLGSHPAAAWIRFLRSYGPTPENGVLFDEHVSKALAKAKVQAIILPTPRLAEIVERVTSGASGSILIAGTAGDGKTSIAEAFGWHWRKQ